MPNIIYINAFWIKLPNITCFKDVICTAEELEYYIAFKNNLVHIHNKNGGNVITIFQNVCLFMSVYVYCIVIVLSFLY